MSEPADDSAQGPGATQQQDLAEGLQFSMPESGGVDAATLAAEGVGKVEADVGDLMAQLAALGGK